MNYARIYDQLIERARVRSRPEGYVEHHHVIPRCMGGGDEPDNLVALSAREHYVAHLLLVKIHPKEHKLWAAVSALSGKHKRVIPSWWYKAAKEACFEVWKTRGAALSKKALENGYLLKAVEAARFSQNQKSAARVNQKKCVEAVIGKVPVTSPEGKWTLALPEEVTDLIGAGWKEGHTGWRANTNKANARCRGSVLMTDLTGKTRFVKPNDIEEKLKLGWTKGCGHNHSIKLSKRNTLGMTSPLGKHKFIKLEQVEAMILEGWTKGFV